MTVAASVVMLALWGVPGCASTASATPGLRSGEGDPASPVQISAQVVGSDTVARYFHKASTIEGGFIMVSGGLGLQLFPSPSLFSRSNISFFNPATLTFSASFEPLGGGAAVSPTLHTPRSYHTQTTLHDGRVLITGGYTNASGTSSGSPTDSAELFDPMTGLLSEIGPMHRARADHSATLLSDGRVLIAGGDTVGTWELFDPVSDSFGPTDFAMQRRRAGHTATLLLLPADPPNASRAGAMRRVGRAPARSSSATETECVLLIAGRGTGGDTLEYLVPGTMDGEIEPSAQLIDVALDIPMDDHAALRLDDGRVLIVGGQNLQNGNTVNTCWLFDPASAQLLTRPPVLDHPDGIADHNLLPMMMGRFALVLGGESQLDNVDTELDSIAVFDALTQQWVHSSAMHFPHDDAPVVKLDEHRVLIIGGGVPLFGFEAPSANAEIVTVLCQVPGDATGDCRVNVLDLLAVIGQWGCAGEDDGGGECECPCPADVTSDCVVNVLDLLSVIANWGS